MECGIFADQGLNLCPLHWKADSYLLRHQGSPAIFKLQSHLLFYLRFFFFLRLTCFPFKVFTELITILLLLCASVFWPWGIWDLNSPAAAAAESLQSCLTLCDPIDGLLPGSSVPGILQARTLEWVAIAFSNAWKWKVKVLSCVRILATPRTAACQAPPSMGFSRQEYCSGVPLTPLPGIKPVPPALNGEVLTLDHQGGPSHIFNKKQKWGNSLAVHWLGLCFPCQGLGFKPWLGN